MSESALSGLFAEKILNGTKEVYYNTDDTFVTVYAGQINLTGDLRPLILEI